MTPPSTWNTIPKHPDVDLENGTYVRAPSKLSPDTKHYILSGDRWTISTWFSEAGGNLSVKELCLYWFAMPIVINRKSNNQWHSKRERDRNKMQRSHEKMTNLDNYLTKINMVPQNRSMRAFAKNYLDEFIVADAHFRNTINRADFDLKRLPDLTSTPTSETVDDLETRGDHDDRHAVQLTALPMAHRRVLYPGLQDHELTDPCIYVPAELYYACSAKVTLQIENKPVTRRCGQVRRNTTSWTHEYKKTGRTRNRWYCSACSRLWQRQLGGTRFVVLRTPFSTIQYRTDEPSADIDRKRKQHMATFYKKIEGPQPRRDTEHLEDHPDRTMRFDLSDNTDPGNLKDKLHAAPDDSQFADWLMAMLTEHT